MNMRFIQDYSSGFGLSLRHSIISKLWSLQTLILLRKEVVAPAEIWMMMPQLRHVEIANLSLRKPPPPSDDEVCVLQNLPTLERVQNLIFTKEVCKMIPNIKQLDIKYDMELCYHVENLGCFNKLESLDYYWHVPKYYAGDSIRNIKFSSSLKKLSLNGCKLGWSCMAVIASLPRLQYLFLDENAVAAIEWVFVDERFVSLKYLFMTRRRYVTTWTAQSFNFPVLEKLSFSKFWKLDEIPSSIGEIPTLQSIHVYDCSKSDNISAVEILR